MTVVELQQPDSNGVGLLEQAKALLAQASSVDEVKDVRDRAEALRMYAKQAGLGLDMQNQAAEVKLRAERRAGELLAEMPKHNGDPRSHDVTRLSDLGIQKMESSRWQRIASLPEAAFESYIGMALEARREVTTSGALKLAKQTREQSDASSPLPQLPDGMFRTITADPPWQYDNKSTRGAAEDHYGTLSIPQLTGDELLPDGTNLAKQVQERTHDQAHLYMWTTAGFLRDAFDVMEAWGFTYKTFLVWCKPQMGMGNYFRISSEPVLFGVKGGLGTNHKGLKNWFEAKRGRHSAKPEAFYDDLVTPASPGPYLEMFGRCWREEMLPGGCRCTRCRLGWEIWGNQS
jgi:N6-adenosine-specific RNA methylase IME4